MSDAVLKRLFFVSLVVLAVGYGIVSDRYHLFPVPFILNAKAAAEQLLQQSGATRPWYLQSTTRTSSVDTVSTLARLAPGLRLVAGLDANDFTSVKVMRADGHVVHQWSIDWFSLWPNPNHLTEALRPKTKPVLVMGMAVATNGDLIFNFFELGLMRLNACGEVVWRVPYRTHHSVHLDDAGNIWVPGMITRTERMATRPNYAPPFDDYTVLEISPDGKILQEMSVFDILAANRLEGLLYMATTAASTSVTGDTLHLNDVEVFPSSMAPGLFSPGDLMLSLRNINTVLVVDGQTRQVKFISTGQVLRQHDPDFVDGDTISVFDNHNLAIWGEGTLPDPAGHYSRVVRLSAPTRISSVAYSGTKDAPLFTYRMGSHQDLPNGHTLLVESVSGRVVEVDQDDRVVWQYFNLVGNGLTAVVNDAQVLPPAFDDQFFTQAVAACQAKSASGTN